MGGERTGGRRARRFLAPGKTNGTAIQFHLVPSSSIACMPRPRPLFRFPGSIYPVHRRMQVVEDKEVLSVAEQGFEPRTHGL